MFTSIIERITHPPAFGLDISDRSVKFVRLAKRGEQRELLYFGETALPPDLIASGDITKPNDVARLLRDNLKIENGHRVSDRYCVVSLPEEKSFVELVQLPDMKDEDIAHAVRWELEGIVPLPIGELYFDYQVLPGAAPGSGPRHRDVLVTAFPRKTIDGYTEALRASGLVPLALELESQAISRALMSAAMSREPTIIVDLGATRTSFIIIAGGSIVFTKSSSTGGGDFDAAIAKSLGASLEKAREAKIEGGLNKNFGNGKVFEALQPLLAGLLKELEEQMWYYRDHPKKSHPEFGDIETILLCGGDANLIGIEKYIGAVLKKRVEHGDPFAAFHLGEDVLPPIPKNQALKYTTAIGLALRASGENAPS